MNSTTVIQHLILPREAIEALAVAARIRTVMLFRAGLVCSRVPVEITVAGKASAASWVMAAGPARRHIASCGVVRMG